jgi:hypothetical protein
MAYRYNTVTINMKIKILGYSSESLEQLQHELVNPYATDTFDLSSNLLGRFAASALIKAFSTMSSSIISLNLAVNCLYYFSKSGELSSLFLSFPDSLESLSLRKNGFGIGQSSCRGLINALPSLPQTLQQLDLSENHLHRMSVFGVGFNLVQTFGNPHPNDFINKHCDQYIISDSGLWYYNYIEKTLKKLTFKGRKSITELCRLLQLKTTSPEDFELIIRDFTNHNFGFTSLIFQLPKAINNLNLSKNFLGKIPSKVLAEGLRDLSPFVITLDLSDNQLHLLNDTELSDVLNAIPSTVSNLDLSDNHFSENQIQTIVLPILGAKNILLFNLSKEPVSTMEPYPVPIEEPAFSSSLAIAATPSFFATSSGSKLSASSKTSDLSNLNSSQFP